MSQCRSCGAEIKWMKTVNGKNIPVDAETVVEDGATIFDPAVHTSHFATCPNADQHRTPRTPGGDPRSGTVQSGLVNYPLKRHWNYYRGLNKNIQVMSGLDLVLMVVLILSFMLRDMNF